MRIYRKLEDIFPERPSLIKASPQKLSKFTVKSISRKKIQTGEFKPSSLYEHFGYRPVFAVDPNEQYVFEMYLPIEKDRLGISLKRGLIRKLREKQELCEEIKTDSSMTSLGGCAGWEYDPKIRKRNKFRALMSPGRR